VSGRDRRLARLAVVWRAPEGCDRCRGWGDAALANDDGARSRPERCPDCGRGVPIRPLVVVAGVDFRLI